MTRREGDRLFIAGPVTLANVTKTLEDSLAQLRAGASVVDLSEVTDLDSSLLAAILALVREARATSRKLVLANLPEGLQTLAALYGVGELLPVS